MERIAAGRGRLRSGWEDTVPAPDWDQVYQARSPGWDIGRPQPVLVRLADGGLLRGRVLDAGLAGHHSPALMHAIQHGH